MNKIPTITFGKFKDRPASEASPGYLLWLYKQSFVKRMYPDLYRYIRSVYREIKAERAAELDLMDELSAIGSGAWEWWKD